MLANPPPTAKMDSNISISLRKYSFTDTSEKPFHWEHEMGPGLTLAFAPPHLKITIGRKVLDSVDVHQKVQQTKAQLAAMQANGEPIRNDDLPISAMTRPNQPALGILYRKSSRKIRRIQLTFNSTSDSNIAYDIIVRWGVKMFTSKAGLGPSLSEIQSRPPSQSAAESRPTSAMMDTQPLQSAVMGTADFSSSPPGMRRLALQNSLRDYTGSEQIIFGQPNVRDEERLRPSTAPAAGFASGLMDMLPPRRELPFSRPNSRDSASFSTSQHHSTNAQLANRQPSLARRPSTANLPPLKGPAYAPRPVRASNITNSVTNMPPPQSSSQYHTSQYFSPQPAQSSQTHSSESWAELRPGSSSSKRLQIDNPDTGEPSHPQKQSHVTNAERQADYMGSGDLTDLIQDAGQPEASRRLQSYAAQPDGVRQEIINDFLVNCIEDDAFITLCEDVAANWRRIGLGLQ